MLKIKSLWLMSFAALVLAGCSSTPPVDPKDDTGREDDDDDDQPPLAPPSVAPDAPELVAAVSSLFREKCSDCHGKGQSFGQLQDLFDVPELKRRNLIGANADSSVLFNKVKGQDHAEGRSNPRTGQKVFLPNDQDINFLKLWIDAGAPDLRGNRSNIGIAEYLQLLRLGVSKLPRPEQAQAVVIDFHSVYNNNRFSNSELQAFVNASVKILNELDVRSASPNGTGVNVVQDDNNLPMGIVFNPTAFNLDKQQDIINTIVRLDNRQDINDPFECDVPSIPVIDFLHIASSDDVFNTFGDNGQGTFESGYSNIGLRRLLEDAGIAQPGQLVFDPITVQQFINNGFTNISNNFDVFDLLEAHDQNNLDRQTLDILYNQGNDDERVVRGCLLNSNVSAANRCIDRYTLSTSRGGAAYISWDILSFENSNQNKDFFEAGFVGPANPPNDPLVRPQDGFQPFNIDGGEFIGQLKNSMLSFAVFNGNFQLLSNPPTEAVLNLDNLERGAEISVSACTYCHSSYTIPWTDAILPTLLGSKNGREFGEAGFAFKFAQTQEVWDQTFDIDSQYYVEALRRVYYTQSENNDLADGIWSLGKQYLNDLSIEDILAELGLINEEVFFDALDNIVDLGADISQAFGGGLSRENFTNNFQALVEQVSTGNEDYLRGCIAREVSEVGDFGDQDDGNDNGSNDGEN
jgi:hypothetical protein